MSWTQIFEFPTTFSTPSTIHTLKVETDSQALLRIRSYSSSGMFSNNPFPSEYSSYSFYDTKTYKYRLRIVNNNNGAILGYINFEPVNIPNFTLGELRISLSSNIFIKVYIERMVANNSPILAIFDIHNKSITQNQIIKHSNQTLFLIKILADDSDTNDTLQYSIWLRNSEYATWTSIGKDIETIVSIPFDNLLIGNNTIQVKVRDSNGAETSITFVVANINPQSYSQQHVYELIIAIGYAPTGNSSLMELKYPEYNKATLSLAELVNFLQ